jgi:tRNA modification GTPase
MNLEDTIVAISSPRGSAARGIVRLSGSESVRIAAGLFSPSEGEDLRAVVENRYIEGRVSVGPGWLPAAVYLFRSPRSYTRQDVVELHLLGSPGVLSLLVEACLAAGARRAEPGEFTARAFLAGAFDLSQVHGIAGMIAARSDHQLRAAERLLHGALAKTAEQAREELADLLSLVEGAMDFADEPIEFISIGELRRRLATVHESLQSTAAAGLRAERWGQLAHVVLAGRPNVGKSSLLNRLTGIDRAICAPMAGTTRDLLSAPLELESGECLLIDAAGLTEEGDAAGLHGQAQAAARDAVKHADLVLHVVDATMSLAGEGHDWPALAESSAPRLIVANKCDLVSHEQLATIERGLRPRAGVPVCLVSATTGMGCEALRSEIERVLSGRPVDVHDASIALMAEHRDALERAMDALERAIGLAAEGCQTLQNAELVAVELHVAADALGVLVGREDTEDLLGRIFSRFCIGK